MQKMIMISMRASANQVRFVPYLATYFDVHHYFYKDVDVAWKRVPFANRCHLLDCGFKWHDRFFSIKILRILRKHDPDIIFIGGMSIPGNYLAYLWGKWHGRKVGVFTERSRVMGTGEPRQYDWKWRLLHWMYRKIDFVMVTSEDIVPQFRDTFGFGGKVVAGRYPSDIDKYYGTPARVRKDAYTIIYPNRMIDIYNPMGAVNIFAKVLKRYPRTIMRMNATGELRPQVEARIRELGISSNVVFLDSLKAWDDLVAVYATSDIMMLPAKFSNGNFTIEECAISGLACIISNKVKGACAMLPRKEDVLDLSEDLFVERICYYIEHPEEISRNVEFCRERLRPVTLAGTAKLYKDIIERMCK